MSKLTKKSAHRPRLNSTDLPLKISSKSILSPAQRGRPTKKMKWFTEEQIYERADYRNIEGAVDCHLDLTP
jgi:hypothetical protein